MVLNSCSAQSAATFSRCTMCGALETFQTAILLHVRLTVVSQECQMVLTSCSAQPAATNQGTLCAILHRHCRLNPAAHEIDH